MFDNLFTFHHKMRRNHKVCFVNVTELNKKILYFKNSRHINHFAVIYFRVGLFVSLWDQEHSLHPSEKLWKIIRFYLYAKYSSRIFEGNSLP